MKKEYYVKMLFIVGVMALLVVTFSVSTYAWFTKNRQVESSRVSVSSGSQELDLLIATEKDGEYSKETEIFADSNDVLLPVSTVDLVNYYKPATVSLEGESNFVKIDKDYYKEELYLRTTADGFLPTDTLQLYIDADGIMLFDEGSKLETSVRVGLIFTCGEVSKKVILSFDSTEQENTVISNLIDGVPSYEADPSEFVGNYTIEEDGNNITLPSKYLIDLPLNEICKVEVFCYLEGNDKDCKNELREKEMRIQVPFYGVLSSSGDMS